MKMSLPSLDSCVTLLANNNVWHTNIGSKKYKLNASLERLFAYHIYVSKDMYVISGTIRCQDKDVTPAEIDQFVSDFKQSHPLEQLPFKWSHIQHCSTDELLLDIPNSYGYRIALEKWQEIRLLHVLRSSRNPKQSVEQWFLDYTEKYAITPKYKCDISTHHLELAATFCELHGIDINNIPQEKVVYHSKTEQVIAICYQHIKMWAFIFLYIAVAVMLMHYHDTITDSFILQGIILTIGWLMLILPVVNFINKLKGK